MSWIIYTIIGVLLFSSTNYIEKYLVDKKIKEPLILTISSGPIFLLFGTIIYFFVHLQVVTFIQFSALIGAGIFLIMYLIPYYNALSEEETSRIIPLFQFVPVFTLIFSYIFLNEQLRIPQLIGFVLILFGGFAISLKKIEIEIFSLSKSFWLMILSSLLYTAVPIFFKYAVKSVDFWTAFFYQSIGAFIGSVLLLLFPPYKKTILREIKKLSFFPTFLLFFLHSIGFVGEIAISFAYFLAPVALVTVLAGTQPFFVLFIGIILSVWFPHIVEEDIKKSTLIIKFVAMGLIFAGLYIISI